MSVVFSVKKIFVQTLDALIRLRDISVLVTVMVITGLVISVKTSTNAHFLLFTALVASVLILKDHTLVSAQRFYFH